MEDVHRLVLECLSAVEHAVTEADDGEIDENGAGADVDLKGCSAPALQVVNTVLQEVFVAIETLTLHSSQRLTLSPDAPVALFCKLDRQSLALSRMCDERFLCCNYAEIPTYWRRLYTDAVMLAACAGLVLLQPSKELGYTAEFESLIRRLDMAIIVSGCPGVARMELVQGLIAACQAVLRKHPSCTEANEESFPEIFPRSKKRRLDSLLFLSDPLFQPESLADQSIQVYEVPPSLTQFLDRSKGVYLRPFIVRGFANDWPAMAPHRSGSCRWASAEYLRDVAGRARVVPVEVGAKYTDEDWGQDIVLWSDFLRLSCWGQNEQMQARGKEEQASQTPTLYLAQHSLLSQFPGLRNDIVLPDYVYAGSAPPPDVAGYRPPGNEEALILNAWLGPSSTISPPHYDMYYNCFVQVVGHKEVWLAPPHANRDGQMSSFGSSPCGKDAEPSTARSDNASKDDSISTSLMTNTSQLDVFAGQSSSTFDSDVRPIAQSAVLGPGDLLFMPPGWWHSFKSRSKSFSVSMWF